jgi:hypothetical protein
MDDETLAPFRERAERVIDVAYGGQHHVFSLKWAYRGYVGEVCTFLVNEGAATYDFSDLTRMVTSCHDACVRGEIRNGGPGRLRIVLTPRARKHRHPDAGAHPTLEQHVEQIRRGGSYQPLFNLLRAEEGAK